MKKSMILSMCTAAALLCGLPAHAVNYTISVDTTWTSYPTDIDDLTIDAGVTLTLGGAWTDVLQVANDLTVNGTLTHADNATVETYRVNVSVGGNATVAGAINVLGRGYDRRYGPGAPVPFGAREGGTHGGMGNRNDALTYGSITDPENLGSGGGDYNGGGAVKLVVAGSLQVDGLITAAGTGVNRIASGAGGSISIEAATIGGAGALNADGGDYDGGGGRIAVVGDSSSFTGSMSAYGGARNNTQRSIDKGAGGTIYLETPGTHSPGQGILIIDDNGPFTLGALGTPMPGAVNLNQFSEIVVKNFGTLIIDADDTIDLGTANISGGGDLYIGDNLAGATIPNPFTISGYNLIVNSDSTPVNFTGDWTVAADGGLSHLVNFKSTAFNGSTEYKLNLALDGNLTMNGTIDVTSRGYAGPGRDGFTGGPGGANGDVGASYGGQGGRKDTVPLRTTYGSICEPTDLGSGGGNSEWDPSGGGAVILNVTGTTEVNGTISADGIPTGRSGGSSGGSVFLTTDSLTGTGTIQANGGAGPADDGGGGGGRVAVVLTDGAFADFGGAITAYGGIGWSGRAWGSGAAGTVYGTQADGLELVRIDNNSTGNDVGNYTHIPAATSPGGCDLSCAYLQLRNGGDAQLTADVTVVGVQNDGSGTLDLNGFTLTETGTECVIPSCIDCADLQALVEAAICAGEASYTSAAELIAAIEAEMQAQLDASGLIVCAPDTFESCLAALIAAISP